MSQYSCPQELLCEQDQIAFERISNLVGSTEWQIIENNARHEASAKIHEKQQHKIKENKLKTTIEKEHHYNVKLQRDMVEKSNTSQMNNIACMERGVIYYMDLLNRSILEKQEMKENFANITKMYENKYEEIENIHKRMNPAHHDLHVIQTEFSKNEIALKDLNARIQACDRAKQQFDDIQKRIYEQKMVEFAKRYLAYHENEENVHQVKILNEEKSKHLKEHLQLQARVKLESSQGLHASATGIGREPLNERTVANAVVVTSNRGDCYSKQLEDFIKADVKPVRKNITSLKMPAPETSKIKVLNVTKMEPLRKIMKEHRSENDAKGPMDKSSKSSKKVLQKKSVRFQECEMTPKKQEKIHPSPSLFNLIDKNLPGDSDNKRKLTSEEPKKALLPDLKRLRQELSTKTNQRLSQERKQSSQQRLSQEIKLSGQQKQQLQSMGQRLSQETKNKRSVNQQKKTEPVQQYNFMGGRSQDNPMISSMETEVSQGGYLFGKDETAEPSFAMSMFNATATSELSTENENNSITETDEKDDALPSPFNFNYSTSHQTSSYINFDIMD